jgi:ABC-type bacteriocin/lantibiotic exporter with double-glycine peptidase domain
MSLSETQDTRVRVVLDAMPVLALLPEELRTLVVESFAPVSYVFGEPIIRQGEVGDAFYVIERGRARVVVGGADGTEIPLDRFGPGDSFGETALLDDVPRTATVRASTAVDALRLDRGVFDALVRLHPEVREALALQARARRLEQVFRVHRIFSALPREAAAEVLPEIDEVTAAPGELVVEAGESALAAFIVEDGRLVASGVPLGAGDVFGETDAYAGQAYATSVEGVQPSRLLRIPAETLRRLASEVPAFAQRLDDEVRVTGSHASAPVQYSELLPAEAQAAVPEVDELPAAPARRARRTRSFPVVRQIDEMDCGAASLAMVCRSFGRNVSLPFIRDAVGTGVDGTSLGGIRRGGERIGLSVRAVKATRDRLEELPLPAVVHWHGNHWVVLYDVDEQKVRIADPASGLRRLAREEFTTEWSGYAALAEPTERLADAPEASSALRWLVPFVRPFRGVLTAVAALALVAAGIEMLLPLATKVIVDDVLPNRDFNLLYVTLAAMLGGLVVVVGATLLQRYLLARVAVSFDLSTSDHVTERMLRLPMAYFAARRAGDIERRTSGLRQARRLLVENGIHALTALAQALVAIVLMVVLCWWLGLLFLVTIPLYVGLMRYSTARMRPAFEAMEEAYGRYQGRQIDAIRGIETVKSMGTEDGLRRRMLSELQRLVDRLFRAELASMIYEGLVNASNFLVLALFLFFGALAVLNDAISVGGFVAFNSLVFLATGPLTRLVSLWDYAQMASVLLGRLQDVFEHEPEQGGAEATLRPVEALHGRVSLRRVGFRYPNAPDSPILTDISLDIPPGTTVAIVGRSGSGKTTLVKCIAGLLEPTEGEILFDGVPSHALRLRELRRKIGFVIQEPYLFDDTIAANIAFGESEPDLRQIVWAAEAANADDFVRRLPLGYDTSIGESGLRLSGGQAQRIAIARAIYHQPPVLLLDEATSSLDTESERVVKENMDRLLEGRTSFVIAHRLSTIRNADLIVVLEQGRIVETGTHAELMDRQGLYFYLHGQQLG